MSTVDLHVQAGPLLGRAQRRLTSARVADHEPVFRGKWYSDTPRPRFGDLVWDMAGADPSRSKQSWAVRFDDLSPEWSVIARELIYWRMNLSKARHVVTLRKFRRNQPIKAGTISAWSLRIHEIAEYAQYLGLGMPKQWTLHETDALRDHIRGTSPVQSFAVVTHALHWMKDLLTLGGIAHDPLQGTGVNEWAGDTASSRRRSGSAVSPEVFRTVVGNAITYIEKCAPDILAARAWIEVYRPDEPTFKTVAADDPIRLEFPDVTSYHTMMLHLALENIGGIPTSTCDPLNSTSSGDGDICLRTLRAAAGLRLNPVTPQIAAGARLISHHQAAGMPLVPGGLPVTVSNIERADGSTGLWRDSFCWQSVSVELETLSHACRIVLMAFTAMRDSELARIPRMGWRTTWAGADAITAPLIKNAHGESMKWWATPLVLRACEILELLADPDAEFLLTRIRRGGHQVAVNELADVRSHNWEAIQKFVRRLRIDQHLHGFHDISAGWKNIPHGLAETRSNDDLPSLNPRQFRFTLASISNFVTLGDVAFQQQAKHAKIAMTYSYAANSSTNQWNDILNALTNDEAQQRTELAVDLFMGVWNGSSEPAGHAGRKMTRTIRDLLAGLPPYDPDSTEADVDQFMTRVLSRPEIVAAIKSHAVLLFPGDVCHCLRYTQHMECTDKADPIQGLCHPETCNNVLITPGQTPIYKLRLKQTVADLGMPRVPANQRAILEARKRRLESQLRIEEE